MNGAESIWAQVKDYSPDEYRRAIVDLVVRDAQKNRDGIANKARALRWSVGLTTLEVAAVVAAVVDAATNWL